MFALTLNVLPNTLKITDRVLSYVSEFKATKPVDLGTCQRLSVLGLVAEYTLDSEKNMHIKALSFGNDLHLFNDNAGYSWDVTHKLNRLITALALSQGARQVRVGCDFYSVDPVVRKAKSTVSIFTRALAACRLK